jgi:lambda family phage portal protein
MLSALRSLFRGRPPRAGKRSFKATGGGRLTMDWIVAPLSADAAMQGHLPTMRNRARDLERNNEWVRSFLRCCENNVIGENGITLQMRVQDPTGRFDEIANDRIELAWWQWGRPSRCDVSGRHSWRDLQRLILRSIARDGEVLVRKIRTRDGLRLQVIEADLLDETDSRRAPNGNEVRFGVELDANRRPVAYHMLGRHPGDTGFVGGHPSTQERIRIPAAEILHLFLSERPDQTRGLPWCVASMARLKMLDGYAEAELVAARTGAAKMGFFTKDTPDGWTGEIDGDGNLSMDATPGTIEELPPGVNFKSWDTNHPNSGYGDYVKNMLRGVASSLGISYNTLTSDLEGVNYSSIRAGLLEEREVWKSIQRFLIEHLCEPVFEEWLLIELASGRLGLPLEKFWKFHAPEFRGRRWAWVDPKKDMDAAIAARRAGLSSLRDTIAAAGGDVFDVFRSIKADDELAAQLGIQLPAIHEEPAAVVSAEIDNAE